MPAWDICLMVDRYRGSREIMLNEIGTVPALSGVEGIFAGI